MSFDAVVLTVAAPSDAPLLANLLELYIHDLSDVFAQPELGADGRFGYSKLPLYWSEPERRSPYLIRQGQRAVGFVLVTRGSPVVEDADVHDVSEFFVVRRYRRSGVGREAAKLLWRQRPGKWSVRVSEGNRAALAFWSQVVAEFTAGNATEWTRPGEPHPWRVFYFDSPGP